MFIVFLEKPGKSKFAPSIGGRKAKDSESSSSVAATGSASAAVVPSVISQSTEETEFKDETNLANAKVNVNPDTIASPSPIKTETTIVGKKIESVQSRRMTTAATSLNNTSTNTNSTDQNIKLPSGPKDAASIATSITGSNGATAAEKRTMAYYLKDSGEGREMPNVQAAGNGSSTDPSLSPSKTRRIVNLRNIKAPSRSAATSTALAPQVRVVNGAIVYDEKFSAAISIPVGSKIGDLEEEVEYVDEDDEHGKHLTSATYSVRSKGSNRWNSSETDLFYEALSMCGTDFSIVQTFFPHRTRAQVKGKYKLEEKSNAKRINAALKDKKAFDPTFKDRVEEFTNAKK